MDDCIQSDDVSENGDNDFDDNFTQILALYTYVYIYFLNIILNIKIILMKVYRICIATFG